MSSVNPIPLGDFAGTAIGGDNPFVLIAGPCVIESERHATDLAVRIADNRRSRLRRAVHLQGVVRQSEPHIVIARIAGPD